MLLFQESPEQPSCPHSSSAASWPVAMETHWHSTLASPNQVSPGATLTLGAVLETLSAQSSVLPLLFPLGCYLAFAVGLVGGPGARPWESSMVMNYSRGKKTLPGSTPPAPKGSFRGFPQTAQLWAPMPLSSFSVVPRSWWGATTRPCASSASSWEQGLGCQWDLWGQGRSWLRALRCTQRSGVLLGPPTLPVTLQSHGWPHLPALTRRPGRAEFRLFVHGPSWQHWHSSRRL